MKRLILAVVICLTLVSCERSDSFYTKQRLFDVEGLVGISPTGLEFNKPVGTNWWEGTYKNKPVLIHAIQTNLYVSVNFQYIE